MLLICEAEEPELAVVPLLHNQGRLSVAQKLASMLSHGPLQSNKSVPDRHSSMELEPSNAATETHVYPEAPGVYPVQGQLKCCCIQRAFLQAAQTSHTGRTVSYGVS